MKHDKIALMILTFHFGLGDLTERRGGVYQA